MSRGYMPSHHPNLTLTEEMLTPNPSSGEAPLASGGEKKGTLIFTGTLGALRTNAQFSAYGVCYSC